MAMTQGADWVETGQFTDIKYFVVEGIAKIVINRPEVRNAFRPQTVFEMSKALGLAQEDPEVGVIILTGEGEKAFCSGGDQRIRGDAGYSDEKGVNRLNVLEFQRQMRVCPKPIIAMVAGYAIGGGHVLHLLCDLTIAADTPAPAARRRQARLCFCHRDQIAKQTEHPKQHPGRGSNQYPRPGQIRIRGLGRD